MSASKADLRLFPLPALGRQGGDYGAGRSVEPVRSRARVGASPPVATLGLGVITDAPSRTQNDTSLQDSGAPRSRQIASRQMRHRHHLAAPCGAGQWDRSPESGRTVGVRQARAPSRETT